MCPVPQSTRKRNRAEGHVFTLEAFITRFTSKPTRPGVESWQQISNRRACSWLTCCEKPWRTFLPGRHNKPPGEDSGVSEKPRAHSESHLSSIAVTAVTGGEALAYSYACLESHLPTEWNHVAPTNETHLPFRRVCPPSKRFRVEATPPSSDHLLSVIRVVALKLLK